MTRMTGPDCAVMCNLINTRTHGERKGRGGGGDGQQEQWEDPLGTQPDREIELSQTTRGVGGVCVGVVPRVQSKLSRALHAHRGTKLLQDFQTQESAAMKRAMVRFRGVRGKGAMSFVECLKGRTGSGAGFESGAETETVTGVGTETVTGSGVGTGT